MKTVQMQVPVYEFSELDEDTRYRISCDTCDDSLNDDMEIEFQYMLGDSFTHSEMHLDYSLDVVCPGCVVYGKIDLGDLCRFAHLPRFGTGAKLVVGGGYIGIYRIWDQWKNGHTRDELIELFTDSDYYGTVSDTSGEPLPAWRVGHFVDAIMQAMQELGTYMYDYAELLVEDYYLSEEWYEGRLFFKDGTEYFGDVAA